MNDEMQLATKLLQPTLAASVWKTFRALTGLLLFLSWMISLPVELLLHRRIGKRYMNTVFAVVSYVMLAVLLSLCTTSSARAGRSPMQLIEAMRINSQLSALLLSVPLAFVVHYVCNRRRFARPDQGHSLDSGIPWLIFPPFARNLAASLRKRLTRKPADSSQAPHATVAEISAYAGSAWTRLREHVMTHLQATASGEPPHGPFTWLFVSIIEPLLLALGGLGLLMHSSGPNPLGLYLIIVAVAMVLKSTIHQAEWRERMYDEVDQRLEMNAMRNWRDGQKLTNLSPLFTVPVTKAVVVPSGNNPAPLVSGPDFDHLLRPGAMLDQDGISDPPKARHDGRDATAMRP